jgi:hypothetical protein
MISHLLIPFRNLIVNNLEFQSYMYTAALGTARHKQPMQLGMELRARSRICDMGFQPPIPQIVCIESDAEKVSGKESEFRRSHSNDTDEDAVCSSNDPALP